jgi:hypothetical protein
MSEQQQAGTPAVSMSNTKKEMLAAYQAMKHLLEEKQQELLDAEKQKAQFKKKAAVVAADKAVAEDPVRRIQDLKSSIGRELTALADKFEAETEKYAQLKDAIVEKQAELRRIYEVETAALDLAALLEAQRRTKEEFEADMKNRRETFEAEMAEAAADWEKQKRARDQQLKEEERVGKRNREREEEEYEYKLKRKREQQSNKLEDEMAAFEKEIATRREEFERQAVAKQAELDEREKAVAERESHADDLQRKVDSFPQEMEEKLAAAVKATTERLNAEHAAKGALQEKEFEGERNVLSSKIEALEKLVDSQARQIDALAKQQENAYEKVQDIASKAVAGARTSMFPFAPGHGQGKQREAGELEKGL